MVKKFWRLQGKISKSGHFARALVKASIIHAIGMTTSKDHYTHNKWYQKPYNHYFTVTP